MVGRAVLLPTPGLVPVSLEPCSQLGTGVRRRHLTEHSDCGPSLPPHSDLTFWCSYATERLERGERLSLEPILALWETVEGQDVVSANVCMWWKQELSISKHWIVGNQQE